MTKEIRIVVDDTNKIEVYMNDDLIAVSEECFSFDSAVNFMIFNGDGSDFINAVKYSKRHNNKFPASIKELAGVKNADDCYCTAIIKLTRHLGESLESRAFALLKNAIETATAEKDFVKFFDALKIINS